MIICLLVEHCHVSCPDFFTTITAREHEGVKGKTPAEACGSKIERDNKWKTLIENIPGGKPLT
jgi:Fe-S-cluster-containing hydrogenase component 2